MKIFRKILVWSLLIIFVMTAFSGCGKSGQGNDKTNNSNEDVVTINIAYQYGLAYAPLIIAQEKELVEQKYKEATGKEVEVIWTQMSSGADINTGIASGSLDVGFMGIAPAITGVTGSVGYKIFTNLSGQEHGLMTNDNKYQSIDDLIGMDKQIRMIFAAQVVHDFFQQLTVFFTALFARNHLGILLDTPYGPQEHIGVFHFINLQVVRLIIDKAHHGLTGCFHHGFKLFHFVNGQCQARKRNEQVACTALEPRITCQDV